MSYGSRVDDNPYRSPQAANADEPIGGPCRAVLRDLLGGLFVGITHGSFVGAAVAVSMVLLILPIHKYMEITPYSIVQYVLSASIAGAVCGLLIGATTGMAIILSSRWKPIGPLVLQPLAVMLGLICGGLWTGVPLVVADNVSPGAALLLGHGLVTGGVTGWLSSRTLRRVLRSD